MLNVKWEAGWGKIIAVGLCTAILKPSGQLPRVHGEVGWLLGKYGGKHRAARLRS